MRSIQQTYTDDRGALAKIKVLIKREVVKNLTFRPSCANRCVIGGKHNKAKLL